MNLTRRNFIKIAGVTAGVAAEFLNLGCLEKELERETKYVDLKELIRNPQPYDRKNIITEGFPEYVGKREFEEPHYFYDASGKVTNISFSKKDYTTHKLHTKPDTNSDFFFIAERALSEDEKIFSKIGSKIRVKGVVGERELLDYFLKMKTAEEIVSEIPTIPSYAVPPQTVNY